MDADVLIVGAGPAGTALGILLARRGFDVLLLDRRAPPRAKPCGDCINPGAAPLLRRLGVLDELRAVGPARIAGWRIHSPAGHAFTTRFHDVSATRHGAEADGGDNQYALALERADLDALLVRHAVGAGVRLRAPLHVMALVWAGTRVTGVRARGPGGVVTLSAHCIVGADGLRSTVATRLGVSRYGRRNRVSLTMHVRGIALPDDCGEMHVGDGVTFGIAPVSGGSTPHYNLTFVADADRFGPALARAPLELLRRQAASLPVLPQRLRPSLWHELVDAQRLGSGRFQRTSRRIIFDGAALVGDAAGYLDPFTGQGVHRALADAFLLAPVLADALHARALDRARLEPYRRQRARAVRGALVVQQLVDAVISRPRLADHAIGWLARTPRAARALIAVTADVAPAGSLLSPAAWSSFPQPVQPQEGTG